MDKFFGDNRIKELVPGIERYDEKKKFSQLPEPQSQLKNQELFFRAMNK